MYKKMYPKKVCLLIPSFKQKLSKGKKNHIYQNKALYIQDKTLKILGIFSLSDQGTICQ